MIELRWLHEHDCKILQYRQKIDTTVYAGLGPFPDSAKNMQWSDWVTVPEVGATSLSTTVNKCSKCGLAFIGTMSYTCTQVDCPTGLGSSS